MDLDQQKQRSAELSGMKTSRLLAGYTLLGTRKSTEVLEKLKVKIEIITT